MVKTSVLNDALKTINNAEKAGKRQCMIRPSSKVIVKFLNVMQKHGMSKHHFLERLYSLPSSAHISGLITRRRFLPNFLHRPLPYNCPKD